MYRDHSVLWDFRMKEYKNRNKRDNAFAEIANYFKTKKMETEWKMKILLSRIIFINYSEEDYK